MCLMIRYSSFALAILPSSVDRCRDAAWGCVSASQCVWPLLGKQGVKERTRQHWVVLAARQPPGGLGFLMEADGLERAPGADWSHRVASSVVMSHASRRSRCASSPSGRSPRSSDLIAWVTG